MLLREKLKAIREARGLSQDDLAKLVNLTRSMVNQAESGKQDYSSESLILVREALGANSLPLLEHERKSYSTRLYIFLELVTSRKFEEARQIQKNLSEITILPYNDDLKTLYFLFATRFLLMESNVNEATEIFDSLTSSLNNTTEEVLYHYHYINGLLHSRKAQHKEAFVSYLKALELQKINYGNHRWIYHAVAFCARKTGRIADAIKYLEAARKLNQNGKRTSSDWHIDNSLALNYITFGLFEKSKELLANCLDEARNNNDNMLIGLAYLNYGYLYCKAKDWHTAITYLNNAFDFLEKGTELHLEALYQLIRCLIEAGSTHKCKTLLAEAKELSKDNEERLVAFKSLECILTIKDANSVKYLEEEAIPYYKNLYRNITVLDYCDVLKKEYDRKINTPQKKYYEIAKIENEIYSLMLSGGEL